MDYSIGDLARLTGLTVKAVRFYSDRGIVPPAGRNVAGHRRYGTDAAARLELVRTLRELGLDLRTIRKVANGEITLQDVAAAHAEAVEVQIRVLRLRHAVLSAVAKRGPSPEEMSRLARASEFERRRLVADFLGDVPEGIVRTMTAELPDDPTPEQLDAWVELVELAQDPEFRALMRTLAEPYTQQNEVPRPDQVRRRLGTGDAERRWWEAAADPRRERYLRLLATVNGWAQQESIAR